ncbi:MAG: sigma-70 family RNA polymerase sigma factor [Bacteroidales bacterium]|nr:sigma-70 family RNA polymerase sigma factor [Bacteroidales bacterium]
MMQISDEAIVEGIKLKSQYVINYMYDSMFPGIKRFVESHSGSEEDAQDIFQEAIIVVYQKVMKHHLELSSSFKTFFLAICKNLMFRRFSRNKMDKTKLDYAVESDMMMYEGELVEELRIDEDMVKMGLYRKHFLELEDDCKEMLKLYIKKASYAEIAEVMGFKNEDYVKTRKFMCKEKLKKRIINDPLYKNYFNDEK